MKKRITILGIALGMGMALCACSQNDEKKEENSSVQEQSENEETKETGESQSAQVNESDTTNEANNKVKIESSDWSYAYSSEGFDYYYMALSENTHDSNVVLSIGYDDSIKGKKAEDIKANLEESYKDTEGVDVTIEKFGKTEAVCVELEHSEGETKSYVCMYAIVGEDKATVISVYSVENKYDMAKERTEELVSVITPWEKECINEKSD